MAILITLLKVAISMKPDKSAPLGVGIIGCGLISQLMHLPHLVEMKDMFCIKGICDLSPSVLRSVGNRYHIENRNTNYMEMIKDDNIEALIVCTSSNHYEIVKAALDSGKHVFVEKPMCYLLSEADELIETSEKNNACLMVGYMKLFDPAVKEVKKMLVRSESPAFVQALTINTDEHQYLNHNTFSLDNKNLSQGRNEISLDLLNKELPGLAPNQVTLYTDILLDCTIHDIYLIRELFGDPESLGSCQVWFDGNAIYSDWRCSNSARVQYTFLRYSGSKLPYVERFDIYNNNENIFLHFPSPYLKNVPTRIVSEGIQDGLLNRINHLQSFEEPFKLELIHFYQCVTQGKKPVSSGSDGRKDISIIQEMLKSAQLNG